MDVTFCQSSWRDGMKASIFEPLGRGFNSRSTQIYFSEIIIYFYLIHDLLAFFYAVFLYCPISGWDHGIVWYQLVAANNFQPTLLRSQGDVLWRPELAFFSLFGSVFYIYLPKVDICFTSLSFKFYLFSEIFKPFNYSLKSLISSFSESSYKMQIWTF